MVPNSWISPLGNQTAFFCLNFMTLLCQMKLFFRVHSLHSYLQLCLNEKNQSYMQSITKINYQNQSAKYIVVWNRLRSHIFLKLIWGFGIGVDFLSLLILYFLHSSISTIVHFWKPQAHQGTKKWGQPMKIQIFYDFENVLRTPFPFLPRAILCWMEV